MLPRFDAAYVRILLQYLCNGYNRSGVLSELRLYLVHEVVYYLLVAEYVTVYTF